VKRAICFLMLLACPALAQGVERIEPGQEPPAFNLPGIDGATVSLETLEGGPGVIVFWSTWSPRSLEVLADLRDYQESGQADGLRIVAVNADHELLSESNRIEVARVARELDVTFPVAFDVGLRTYAAYGVLALPTVVVVGEDGRVVYTLGGYPFAYREVLRERILLAYRGVSPLPDGVPVAIGAEPAPWAAADSTPAAEPDPVCVLPRARFCQLQAERDPGSGDAGVIAVRLAVCRGDAEEAERMTRGVASERLSDPDLRFALAGLMLLKGREGEARDVFRSLQRSHPAEGWGDWGLGLVALAAGDEAGALAHMQAAATKGSAAAEAETAALQFLTGYWKEKRRAPSEEGFLAIFTNLAAVRDCLLRQQQG